MSESTELAVVTAQSAVQIFSKGGMDAVLDEIEKKVRAIPLDPSTPEGRELIRSTAYNIARTKTALDAEGKALTEQWREATSKVNAERKKSTERLDALKEEIRKPLTDFEQKEARRVAAHEEALKDITGMLAMLKAYPDMSLVKLQQHQEDFRNMLPGYVWEEFESRATTARIELEQHLAVRIRARQIFDAEQEELKRLRQEKLEREQRERDERLKAEAREEAERKAKAAADAEARRVIEAAEAAERESQRKLKAEADAKEAAERRAREAEERAKQEAEAAVERERHRVAKEKAAEDAARAKREAKREANARLRAKVRAEIHSDLTEQLPEVDAHTLFAITDVLLSASVRHVTVNF